MRAALGHWRVLPRGRLGGGGFSMRQWVTIFERFGTNDEREHGACRLARPLGVRRRTNGA
jgi:hypothetical protein